MQAPRPGGVAFPVHGRRVRDRGDVGNPKRRNVCRLGESFSTISPLSRNFQDSNGAVDRGDVKKLGC
jgi:hypothetical protein